MESVYEGARQWVYRRVNISQRPSKSDPSKSKSLFRRTEGKTKSAQQSDTEGYKVETYLQVQGQGILSD
jgi:hypothetical protein